MRISRGRGHATSYRNAEHSKTREHATLRETFRAVMDVVGRLDAGRTRRQGRRALSERCQYVHVHVRRPPTRIRILHTCLLAPSPRILAQCPSGSNACKSSLKAPPLRSLAPTTSLSVNLPIWSSGGQTNIFAACFLRANWILNRSPACLLLRLSAAPLIAHCDKDRVDIGQRRGDAPPVRGDFLVIR